MTVTHYRRTTQQDNALGIYAGNAAEDGGLARARAGDGEEEGEGTEGGAEESKSAGAAAGAGGASGGPKPYSIEGDSGTRWVKPGAPKEGAMIKQETDRATAGRIRDQLGHESLIFDTSSSDVAKQVSDAYP